MATSTDMKGNVVKMEVDYSDTVDKRIPECEKLATVSILRFHLIFFLWGFSFNDFVWQMLVFLSWVVFFLSQCLVTLSPLIRMGNSAKLWRSF